MKIKSKSLDGINEITYDTETGATTTTLLHTNKFNKYEKLYGGESNIFKILLKDLKEGTFSDCDEGFQYCCYEIISNLQQENQKYKEVIDKAINNSQYWIDYYTRLNSDERIALRLQENIDILKEVE